MGHVIIKGRHSYGLENINVKQWGEGAKLYIGSFNSIAANVEAYLGGNHRADWITTYPFGHINTNNFPSELAPNMDGHPSTKGDIHIENDVWIGESAVLMSGITIGSGSIIGARSVVTKNVKPYTVIAGNPGREIRERFSHEIITELIQLRWWDLPDESIKLIIPYLQAEPCAKIIRSLRSKFKAENDSE